MNTLRIFPKELRKVYLKNMRNGGVTTTPEKYHKKIILISFVITVVFSTVAYFFNFPMYSALGVFLFMNIFFYFQLSLKAAGRIRKMELVFPDVISLMSSNLRAGITIDKAFVMAARKEFAPLDQEILETGKEIATGRDILFALKKMSQRIESEKISKVILLIISGLRAGGNISDLLEETSRNMKEKEVIEKKAASTILMYVIFIFFAVAVGAPVLFALSSVLVQIVINLTANIPDIASTQSDLPFSFSTIPISVNFVVMFSLAFIFVTDLLSCFVIGLVNKGDGKTGLKFFIPLVIASISLFYLVRFILSKLLLNILTF